MKISYNWLRQYINTDLTAQEVGEILTAVGLEVEAIEKVEAVPGGLKGIVVGEVLTCEKHPDADRLRVTTVNLGNGEPVQIVCGAPNVASGQKVLVATIGAKLFPTEGEPFVIKKGKIRGQESHGMICAEDELGLGKSHDGIMVLSETAIAGTPAADFLLLSDDFCMEIGLTPNRTDAFSHYGVARDLYAALRNMKGTKTANVALTKPAVNAISTSSAETGVVVKVENQEACPRYAGITISGIKVEASPKWLQDKLTAIGLRPINNIVDITNYVQHEIGQPLHAFDANKLYGNSIVVRLANAGEKFVTLDNIERTLSESDLVICDSQKPACIAGVFGGLHSGVTDTTSQIFLESAYFHPVYVRKTAKRHGLHTDASFRFERGCDPENVIWALNRAAQLIIEVAGGEVIGEVTDIYPEKIQPFKVDFNWGRCDALIGKAIGKDHVKSILKDLSIEILNETDEGLELSVPVYRSDVQREADVVEEILRIYGYDNIEFPKGLKTSLSYSPKPDPEKLRNKVSDSLSSIGFSEMMSMSLTKSSYLELNETFKSSAVEILNPLSGDLGVMRQTLLFGGLEAIAMNQNHRNPDLRFYEFGKVYNKFTENYVESAKLAIFVTGRRSPESWNNSEDVVSFVDLKASMDHVFKLLGIQDLKFESTEHVFMSEGLTCASGKNNIGNLGSVSEELLKHFDIRQSVWYAELDWDMVLKSLPKSRVQYREPDKFPAVRRDLSLLLDKAIKYSEIEKIALDTEKKLLRGVNLFDVYEGKNLSQGKKSYAVSFILQDSAKTMTDQQVDQVMSRIQKTLEEKLGATLRVG